MRLNLRNILFLLLLPFSFGISDAYTQACGFAYRKKIVIDNAEVVGTTNHVNFPVLISHTDADLRTVANGGYVENANGYDISFLDINLNVLEHEIEFYSPTTGQIVMWVKIPSLPTSYDYEFFIVFGNPAVAADPSVASVWNGGYDGIWHLHNDFLDASGNGNDGTNNGSTDLSPAKSGDGQNFVDPNHWIELPNHPNKGGNSFSYSGWFRTNDNTRAGQRIFCDDQSNGNGCHAISLGDPGTGRIRFFIRGLNPVSLDGPNLVANGVWYHVAATYNSATGLKALYLNGAVIASEVVTGTLQDAAGNASIGGETATGETANRFHGDLDEIHSFDGLLSPEWIETEYNNQDNPTNFYSYSGGIQDNVTHLGPGGVGDECTNKLWLDASQGVYSDAGTTLAVNGNTAQQWHDRSGNGSNAIENTAGQRPTFTTNIVNGNPGLRFDGNDDRMLSTGIGQSDEASLFVTAQYSGLPSANPGLIQASSAGNAFSTTGGDKHIGLWVSNGNNAWGRGVQGNGTQVNIPQTGASGTASGNFYTYINHYDEAAGNVSQFVNGSAAGNVAYNGTLRSITDVGIGRQGGETWQGDISEVILYNIALNSAQRIIVDNYLAAKYNLTLGTNDIYNEDNVGNGNFDFEVAGIGRVDANNFHDDAKGPGIVRILNPTGLDNDEFLIWGHNNGIAQATNTSDLPAGVQARFDRVWRVSEANAAGTGVDVGSIDMHWDLSYLSPITASDLRLLIDDDNDGVFNDETPIGGAIDMGGGIYAFINIPSAAGGIRNNRRFTIGTINLIQTPLPIELISFDAVPKNNHVYLSWETASEINNDYFTLEKSQDGQHFEAFATVKGAGNSNQKLEYGYNDQNPYPGVSYYRLKQTDFDGVFSYSQIRSVSMATEQELLVFPNPSENGEFTIEWDSGLNVSAIEIIDLSGRVVHKEYSANDITQYHFNLNEKGVYILNISHEHGIVSRKIIAH